MIAVLRLFHRLPRDERATTHVALVARAFGASGMVYCGMKDVGMEKSVNKICEKWGGDFFVEYTESWKRTITDYKKKGFSIVHLTMYGKGIPQEMSAVKNTLVVVGSEQVPGEVYQLADYNVAITSQPHSEIAALAVFMDRMMNGKELGAEFDKTQFSKGKIRIVPNERGKSVVNRD
jgi:tRNA (cytidine56-2'-O)-methyltransferase